MAVTEYRQWASKFRNYNERKHSEQNPPPYIMVLSVLVLLLFTRPYTPNLGSPAASTAAPISTPSGPTLGSMPVCTPQYLPTFSTSGVRITGNALTTLTPSITASIPATGASGTTANPVNQLTLLTSLLGGQSLHNERLFIASGIPTVPKKLVAQMRDFKFIDLADLLPPRDAHEGLVPETHSQRYTFFPGWELVRPKRRQVTEIVDWVCAYAIYMACMAQQSPQFIPEMIAHLLTVVRTSEEYEGLYWRVYDTHFRINAEATNNKSWSKVDHDLYSRVFTGRAKRRRNPCRTCDSLRHTTEQCPLKANETPHAQATGSANAIAANYVPWPPDYCRNYNAKGVCNMRNGNCVFRHLCGRCHGQHPAKVCKTPVTNLPRPYSYTRAPAM